MSSILDMIKKMTEKTIINSITCHEDSEFNSKELFDYCNKNQINIYFVKDDSHKIGITNRFHRTLKNKLREHFATNDLNWINVFSVIS